MNVISSKLYRNFNKNEEKDEKHIITVSLYKDQLSGKSECSKFYHH